MPHENVIYVYVWGAPEQPIVIGFGEHRGFTGIINVQNYMQIGLRVTDLQRDNLKV